MTSLDLKKRRSILNLSQWKLAEVLGVHKQTIAAWEQERQAIPAYLELALSELERRSLNQKHYPQAH